MARTLWQSSVDAVVIFIAGIREYVFEAFDVSAFHYLLKPIEEWKFMEVLGKAAEDAGKRKKPETILWRPTFSDKIFIRVLP